MTVAELDTMIVSKDKSSSLSRAVNETFSVLLFSRQFQKSYSQSLLRTSPLHRLMRLGRCYMGKACEQWTIGGLVEKRDGRAELPI